MDVDNCHRDGLTFVGVSLARNSAAGHADTQTHQEQFDLGLLADRDYRWLSKTADAGWLVGGGASGGRQDSCH